MTCASLPCHADAYLRIKQWHIAGGQAAATTVTCFARENIEVADDTSITCLINKRSFDKAPPCAVQAYHNLLINDIVLQKDDWRVM